MVSFKIITLLSFGLIIGSLTDAVFMEWNTPIQAPILWKQLLNEPHPDHVLSMTVVLKIRNADYLMYKMNRISDPDSSEYTQYRSLNDIIEKHSPSIEDVNEVLYWLQSFGINKWNITKSRDFISFKAPVTIIEEMLKIKYYYFQHLESNMKIIRTLDPYSVPKEIAQKVSFITGTSRFPYVPKKKLLSNKPTLKEVTPAEIVKLFNIQNISSYTPKNIQSVAQFLGQYYSPNDLKSFQTKYNLPVIPVDNVVGPNNPNQPGPEASLDIQYIMGISPYIKTWLFYTDGYHAGQEPFVEWAADLNNMDQVPNVISVSYGDDEDSVTLEYANRLEQEFAKLANRGVSVLFSSGDNGVGCNGCTKISPNWPASSPSITSVGGFIDGGSADKFTGDSISSGGFSNFFAQPSYQKESVANYLNTAPNLPPPTSYNVSGRAIPDVSSFSEDVIICLGGGFFPVGGTSCATPVFSAVISIINNELITNGKNPLGFLNPALYKIYKSNPNAYFDITTGRNDFACCKGFPAYKGWDPITGLGGPNFPILKNEFFKLQSK